MKCAHLGVYTKFRVACTRAIEEYNGRIERRGPLPERLERCCQRCDFTWDEAIQPAHGVRPATAEVILYALDLAGKSFSLDLNPELAAHIATRLQDSLHILIRVHRQMRLPRPARPLLVPAAQVPEPDPRAYWWPEPGLRVAYRGRGKPKRG